MGWDFQHREKGQRTEDLIARDLGREIAAFRMVGKVAYMAVEEADGRTWGAVAVTETHPSEWCNWGYKFMDESMGPCYYDCPKCVLDALTPTEYKYAQEWRAKCRANLAKPKAKAGSIIRFAEPVTFRGGWQATTFRVVSLRPSRLIAQDGRIGQTVNIPPSYLKGYTIIGSAE